MKGEIKEGSQNKANYQAAVAKAASDVEEISANIAKLTSDIQGWTANKKSNDATRKQEHKEHQAESADLEESVSALERAVIIIERSFSKNKKIAQTDALLLLQQSAESGEFGAEGSAARDLVVNLMSVEQPSGEAAAYESKSSAVLELLEKTEAEFKDKLHECVTAELHRKQNYEIEQQRLTDLIEGAEQAIDDQSA